MYWELEITEIEGYQGCVWKLDGGTSEKHIPQQGISRLHTLNTICTKHGRQVAGNTAIPSEIMVYETSKIIVKIWTYIYLLAPVD